MLDVCCSVFVTLQSGVGTPVEGPAVAPGASETQASPEADRQI